MPGLHCPPSTPGEGDGGEEGVEVQAGGGINCLVCWGPDLLLPPLPQVGGGVLCAGVAPGCDPSLPHTIVVKK